MSGLSSNLQYFCQLLRFAMKPYSYKCAADWWRVFVSVLCFTLFCAIHGTVFAEEVIDFPSGAVTIAESAGSISLRVELEDARQLEAFLLAAPERLVVDIAGLAIERAYEIHPAETHSISRVRFGIHPEKLRIVFDLTSGVVVADSENPLTVRGKDVALTISGGALSQAAVGLPQTPSVAITKAKTTTMASEKTASVVQKFSATALSAAFPQIATSRKTPIRREVVVSQKPQHIPLPGPAVLPREKSIAPIEVQAGSQSEQQHRDSAERIPPTIDSELAPIAEADAPVSQPKRDGGRGFSDPAQTLQALFDEEQRGVQLDATDIALLILAALLVLVLMAGRMKQSRIRATRDRLYTVEPVVQPKGSHYAVLGCSQDSSNSTIKSRYRHLVKVYHRDVLEHEAISEEVRRLSESHLVRVHEAYKHVRQERGF